MRMGTSSLPLVEKKGKEWKDGCFVIKQVGRTPRRNVLCCAVVVLTGFLKDALRAVAWNQKKSTCVAKVGGDLE